MIPQQASRSPTFAPSYQQGPALPLLPLSLAGPSGTSSLNNVQCPQHFAKTATFSVHRGACGSNTWFQVLQLPPTPFPRIRQWEPILNRIKHQPTSYSGTLSSVWSQTPDAPTLYFDGCCYPLAAQPTRVIPVTTTSVYAWSHPVAGASDRCDTQQPPLIPVDREAHAPLSAIAAPSPTKSSNARYQEDFPDEADDSSSSEDVEVGSDSSEEWGAPRRRRKKRRSIASTKDIDRPFKCTHPRCKKAYSRKTDLQIHERNHTGERPFPCTHPGCSMAFKSRAVMLTHMRLHTGEKPFACPLPGCGARFIQRSNHSRHMQLHAANPGVVRITSRFREEGAGTPSDAEQ